MELSLIFRFRQESLLSFILSQVPATCHPFSLVIGEKNFVVVKRILDLLYLYRMKLRFHRNRVSRRDSVSRRSEVQFQAV